MNVLVIGNGGREHAIVSSFAASSRVKKVFATPGNPGMVDTAEILNFNNFEDIYKLILTHKIDLVFVGPEQYLDKGLADFLQERRITVIGPNQYASKLETSKTFAKELMTRYNIPTADFKVFSDYSAALNSIKKQSYPLVIKADGLAGGKGVFIVQSEHEASVALRTIMYDKKFGQAGDRIIFEEFLQGWEASIFAFTDGKDYKLTIASQDHKRLNNGNQGPNTGGMGAYAPVDKVSLFFDRINSDIFSPLFKALSKEDIEYKGVLYAGLIFTDKGPKVLEFNCRLGDPETQAVLPLLQTDLVDVCEAIDCNRVEDLVLSWKDQYAVNIVAAAKGYPGKSEKGKLIKIDKEVINRDDLRVFFGNTETDHNKNILTSGGRVLSLTALGSSLEIAVKKAYENINHVHFDDIYFRTDIASQS